MKNFWKFNSCFSQAGIGQLQLTWFMCFPLIGQLGKPKITQSLMTSVNNTCNVTLTCSVENEEKNVMYSWSPLGEEGNVLQIFQTPDNQELTYTCTAWNPVSNNSDSIAARQLCTGNQLCPSLLESQKSLWIAVWPEFVPRSPGQCASLGQASLQGHLPSGSPGKESKAFWEMSGISGCSEGAPAWLSDLVSHPSFNSRKYSFLRTLALPWQVSSPWMWTSPPSFLGPFPEI